MRNPVKSAGETVEDAAGAFEFAKAFLFFAKSPRMRNHAATRPARRMLHVKHFMKQNILHGACWNTGTIHAAIQQNLIRPRIVTSELPAPASRAPTDMR